MEKKPISNIDEYIALQPEKLQYNLELLRQTIRDVAPEAEEVIRFSMPAFKLQSVFAYINLHKNHLGLYLFPKVIKAFRSQLTEYKTAKATIQFPLNDSLPIELVSEIIRFAAEDMSETLNSKKAGKIGKFGVTKIEKIS